MTEPVQPRQADLSQRLSLAFTKGGKKPKTYAAPAPLAPLADTHAHLTCFWEKDPAEVLARAALAGVRQLTVPYDPVADGMVPQEFSAQLESWVSGAAALLVAASEAGVEGTPALWHAAYPDARPGETGSVLFANPSWLLTGVRYLVGVHPYGAPAYTDAVHAQVLESLRDPLCVGVGEIGLDYHFDADDNIEAAPHDVQIACMERQLALAIARDMPVELHLRNDADDASREAHADAYRVLSELGVPAAGCVLHCFTEGRATMERFVDLGCYIAYGGAVTFARNEGLREAFAATPLDRVLFETDCPYMAPHPIRGLECEPAMIAFTVDALARDRATRTGEDPVAIASAAWENAQALFA